MKTKTNALTKAGKKYQCYVENTDDKNIKPFDEWLHEISIRPKRKPDNPRFISEEMTFPLAHGCEVYVLRKFPGTEDEKFICRLYGPSGKVIFMSDPHDWDFGVVEEIKSYCACHVAEIIQLAGLHVTILNDQQRL